MGTACFKTFSGKSGADRIKGSYGGKPCPYSESRTMELIRVQRTGEPEEKDLAEAVFLFLSF